MSVIKKSFIKIASLMLGVTLVATACNFGQTSSKSEISQSSSSEVSTQTSLPSPSSDISSSSSSSNNSTSSISSSTSSTSSSIIPTVSGISLNTDNVKKAYNYGDTLNLAGLVVTANYSNNTTTEVTVRSYDNINEYLSDKPVENIRYYNLAGQEIYDPKGVTIKVITYTDKTKETIKIIQK